MSSHAFRALITLSGLLAASPAFGEAKQCVAQNNNGAERRAEHHLLAARDAYRACVAERQCPEMIRSECDTALSELKTAIPTLLVGVVDAEQHDLADAELTLDGQVVALDGSKTPTWFAAHEDVRAPVALRREPRTGP